MPAYTSSPLAGEVRASTPWSQPDHFSDSPATRVATPQARRWALVISIAIGLITVALIPEASKDWGRVPAFLPAYQSTLFLAYLLAGYLVLGHFRASQSQPLLYLSGGFFYTAGIVLIQFLTFPGQFVPDVRLLGGPQSATWLWCLWHIGPVVGIMLYAMAHAREDNRKTAPSLLAVPYMLSAVLALLALSALSVTVFHDALPALDNNGDYRGIITSGVAPTIQLAIAAAVFMLWRVGRFRFELHVWLGVALVALMFDDTITMVGGSRQSAGWYIGRGNALLSALVIVTGYIYELTRVYQKVADGARALSLSNQRLSDKVDQVQLDPLTGLLGRGLFLERAESAMNKCLKADKSVAMLFVDLDGFKAVNDNLGHSVGDEVLSKTALAIRNATRSEDVIGRLGGDEFAVMVTAPRDQIVAIAQRIADDVVASVGKIHSGVGCSIGVSLAPMKGSPHLEELMARADQAMYSAKKLGKGRFEWAVLDGLRVA